MKRFESEFTLIELGYLYLEKKRRITHKEYSIADLLDVCRQILQWSEHKNPNKKNNALKFAFNRLDVR